MRTRSLLLLSFLAGCTGGPVVPSMDASVDAGRDAGMDAGGSDAGVDAGVDAGPLCGPEVCDGLDNDCNGTIDVLPDGGTIFGLCALQQGTCSGARVACTSGGFPPCTAAQYGPKYEEFESLCDGLDNDCSGVVDVSQWKPIGGAGQESRALSLPGAWYIATNSGVQMFDEALTPLTDVYSVSPAGYGAGEAVWFDDYVHQVLQQTPPGRASLRKLNLDGTFLGGSDEVELLPAGSPYFPVGVRVSNDRSTLLATLAGANQASALTLFRDGGVRTPRTVINTGGDWVWAGPLAAGFFTANRDPATGGMELATLGADLTELAARVKLSVPGTPVECGVSANTHALDAGTLVVVCPDFGSTLYGVEDPANGATLIPIWTADAGKVTGVFAAPSYAKATIFWVHRGTLWMGQLNGLPPVELAHLSSPAPERVEIAESVRGGYLLQAQFDGGLGVRRYGAYACPP